MTVMRILGALLGAWTMFYYFFKFRHYQVRRQEFSVAFLFGTALLVASLLPESVTLLRDLLALEDRQFSRLIALLIISNLVLWFLMIHERAKASRASRQYDLLIRHMAIDKFKNTNPDLRFNPITVIIPAYNEVDNIQSVLESIPDRVGTISTSTLVIDDGSQDETDILVRRLGVPLVVHPVRRGGGAALRAGFDAAILGGAEILVTMDADGQHQGSDIAQLVKPIVDQHLDIVVGSRFLGKREPDSRLRLVGIRFFNMLIRILTDVRVSDCSNGFRAFSVAAIGQLDLQQDQYHTPELILTASKKRLRIGEAPVYVKRRRSGTSKKGSNITYGFRFALSIFRSWWR